MPTQIPPIEYNRILQTNSCPETTVALLNEAEITYTKRQKDLLAKKRYPCWIQCAVCGKIVWKPSAWLKRTARPTCCKHCAGILRGQAWGTLGYKGRHAWSEAAERSFSAKMSGAGNPAWKGGVTYFRKHGNYKPIKYVRCPTLFLGMARKDGYVMEHRLLVASELGRCLKCAEVVHHIDHDPQNNDLRNLVLFASNTAHKKHERHGEPAPLWQL